jgi:hypothetical protein
MMGHRTPNMTGGEVDMVYARRYYGHKAGGQTVFVKRSMNRRERAHAKRDLRREVATSSPAL